MSTGLSGRGFSKLSAKRQNAVFVLMVICALAFVLINFIKISYFLGGLNMEAYRSNFLNWLLVPPGLSQLVERPWSFITYMFVHDGVWHMISNMLWLWAFGFILQDLTGSRDIVPIFLYGGLVGALAFVLTVNGFAVLRNNIAGIAPMMGAGSAIMAVAVATTVVSPGYRIFPMLHGGIPLWVLTLVFAAIDFATIASAGAGIGVAHLAGGLMGFLYIKAMDRGADWGGWMHRTNKWIGDLFEPSKEKEKQAARIRQEVFYETRGQQPFKKSYNVTQQRVDELLDKINQKGYSYLTDEEKEYLRRASSEGL